MCVLYTPLTTTWRQPQTCLGRPSCKSACSGNVTNWQASASILLNLVKELIPSHASPSQLLVHWSTRISLPHPSFLQWVHFAWALPTGLAKNLRFGQNAFSESFLSIFFFPSLLPHGQTHISAEVSLHIMLHPHHPSLEPPPVNLLAFAPWRIWANTQTLWCRSYCRWRSWITKRSKKQFYSGPEVLELGFDLRQSDIKTSYFKLSIKRQEIKL